MSHRLHIQWLLWTLALAMIVGVARPAPAATPADVEKAIARGINYLYNVQREDGTWEPDTPYHGQNNGGATALVVYALLAAKESPRNIQMKLAIDYLLKEEIKGIYAVGMRVNVYHLLPRSPEVRQGMHRDLKTLIESVKPKGKGFGLYDYVASKSTRYDHSVSQYGVLGLWACARSGLPVPQEVWKNMDTAWRENQEEDGGWRYIFSKDLGANTTAHPESTVPMTAAGIASLFITTDYTSGLKGTNCTGNVEDKNLEKALAWMSARGDAAVKTASAYTLYGIERIGVASGYKYFGNTDWYDVGADRLVRSQGGAGNWGGATDTAFCILFLVRGRAPVMMNKLEYFVDSKAEKPKPANWNQRPRDVANITRWVSDQTEKDLNWQIVNLKVDTRDLHDSQILYISGKEAPNFTPQEEGELKKFVHQGGMIVANADCASAPFADAIKKLGVKLFGGEFREIPASSPIYTSGQYKPDDWKVKPQVLGLSNGVRELVILFPTIDPARGWQTNSFSGEDRKAQSELMANIFLYSVDKQNLRVKGEYYTIYPNPKIIPTKTAKVARLQYAGNWDPEPGGWQRMSALFHNKFKIKLDVEPVELGKGKLGPAYSVAHLTGTGKFSLPAAARDELRKFVEAGGTLIVDAAGGNADFAGTAQLELESAIPRLKDQLKILPATHALYAGPEKISEVEYRVFARKVLGNIKTPRIRGAGLVSGKTNVYFSAEDLSIGIVGNPIDGVLGYVPSVLTYADGTVRAGATEIMTNLLMSTVAGAAITRPATTTNPSTVPPATAPATKPAPPKSVFEPVN